LSFSYYYLNNPYPKSGYHSDIRYNFFKASVAMQVPFFNRTNKKGFGLSMLMGLSYYNGFGSGEYKSFADKPNAPPVDTNFVQQIRPSHKFSFKSNNLALLSFDIGFSATYIFKRYQFFVDGYYMSVWTFNNSYDKGTLHSKSDTDNNFFGTSPRYSFCINFGIRYCLYQPWQVKPPKRG